MSEQDKTPLRRFIDVAQLCVAVFSLAVASWLGYVGFVFNRDSGLRAEHENSRKNDFDRETRKLELISQWVRKCSSSVESDQKEINAIFSLYARGIVDKAPIVQVFGDEQEFDRFRSNCNTQISTIRAINTSVESAVAPTAGEIELATAPPPTSSAHTNVPSSPSASTNYQPRFWVYLGTYKTSKWLTLYLDGLASQEPDELVGKRFPVNRDTGTLNVRFGAFTVTGDFPPVTKTPLRPGECVHILAVDQWFDSGNWWAIIEPPDISRNTCLSKLSGGH